MFRTKSRKVKEKVTTTSCFKQDKYKKENTDRGEKIDTHVKDSKKNEIYYRKANESEVNGEKAKKIES